MTRLPNESPEYTKLRSELLEAEIALKDQREHVAELRRRLPAGPAVDDYLFREGPRDLANGDEPVREVRLSELFGAPDRPLILVHFMFGKKQTRPCPMCTSFADGYDGALPHILQRANFVVVVAGDVTEFRGYGRGRGWRNLRLLSSAGSDFNRDLGVETADGGQSPAVSVFTRDDDGSVHRFYTGHAPMAANHFRGMDLLSPVWNFFDLLPDGRRDFWPSLSY